MFVDASAIVAILNRETEGEQLIRLLEGTTATTSAIALYEAAHAVARVKSIPLVEAAEIVLNFLEQSEIALVPITGEAGRLAIEASSRFGKGSGHPARLNMGDCFSYAMAKLARAKLLYKGNDFAHTDLG
ncbi:VapC ribonuclease R02377 [Aureimonas endophytica]|uniref:Ribonuclease VapC n=1 Tax=Aureimonas endophytica TaxID=2027858 RepID=A0A917E1D8_9HYPH|nr:type II toxin-antitoxin system VapC family toxin [Aureimonas endophytica]GGD91909.1 VapC ribonuclease R02377 [Aureimonas endophytica]